MKERLYRLLAAMYPAGIVEKVAYYKSVVLSYKLASRLGACGRGTRFGSVEYVTGHRHIRVGSNTVFLPHLFLTAWGGRSDETKISVGDNCSIGAYCHISALRGIIIGDNVLTGKWVTIVDNDHGLTDRTTLDQPPLERELVSKGEIKIGDNVWIGDKATILSGVTIGENSVIAANSVVTRDVPSYCVAAGNPCRVVKRHA